MKAASRLGITLIFFTTTLHAQADWTLLNYIEANNNIASSAQKNIDIMKAIGSTKNVNILVQHSEPTKAHRYKINQDGSAQHAPFNKEMGVNPEQELVNAVQWANTNYPAKHFMLILWSHGTGIIDEEKNKKIYAHHQQKYSHARAILYNYHHETFLSHQQLENALKRIKTIRGKNIDIIGMDACLMGSLEVAYQIKDYADYLIASENVELTPGWLYAGFLRKLVEQNSMTPLQLMNIIVSSFSSANATRSARYTLSGTKLSNLNDLPEKINAVIQAFYASKAIIGNDIEKVLRTAYAATNQFDKLGYLDAHHLFLNMAYGIEKFAKKRTSNDQEILKTLSIKLHALCSNIRKAVVANKTGMLYKKSKGLTIYYPKKTPHPSYFSTMFAQDTFWLSFIQEHRP